MEWTPVIGYGVMRFREILLCDTTGNIQGQNSVPMMSLSSAHLTQRHSGGKRDRSGDTMKDPL